MPSRFFFGAPQSGGSVRTRSPFSRSGPRGSTSPTRPCAPIRRTAISPSSYSDRTASSFSSACWSSAFPPASRTRMLPLEKARACSEALVEQARTAGADAADAVYIGQESESVQVRLRELEQVERSESEEIGLRV